MNPETHDLTSQMRKAAALKRQHQRAPSASRRSAVRQWGRVAGSAFKGAASIAKTSVGIDRADDDLIDTRLNVCRDCPGNHAVWKNGDVHTCGPMLASVKGESDGTCGCVLRKKARDLSEVCPFGWWPK